MPPSTRSRTSQERRPPRLKVAREDAERRLTERITLGHQLLARLSPTMLVAPGTFDAVKADIHKWRKFNGALLEVLFDTDEIANAYGYTTMLGISSHYDNHPVILRKMDESLREQVTYLESVVERLELYEPAPPSGTTTNRSLSRLHETVHLTIKDSTVGTLNLGEILGDIKTHVNQVTGPSAESFKEAITAVSEAVARDTSLANQRKAILEHLDELAEKAKQPPSQRKLSTIKSLFGFIRDAISTGTEAANALEEHGVDITSFFGI